MPRPRSAAMSRRSAGEPWKWIRSFSNTSIASKRAAAIASSLSPSVPDSETVAMHLRNLLPLGNPHQTFDRERVARHAESGHDRARGGREVGVMAERLARVDIRDVKLDHRH